MDKSDPYGFAAELPPRTASIVTDLDTYTWDDEAWMDRRRGNQSARRSRCPSMKSIWAAGGGSRTALPTGTATASWLTKSSNTATKWASRTSN